MQIHARFHHVALSVRDLKRSIDFYRQFGFEPVTEWHAADGSMAIVHLGLDDFCLELFCFAEPTATEQHRRSLMDDLPVLGTRHFALAVKNLSSVIAELEREGMEIAVPRTQGKTGLEYIFIRDPDGILVELVQA